MTTFSSALLHVKQHLDQCLPQQLIFKLCADLKHRWRKGKLDPAVTVQTFLLQLLANVALRGLRHVAGVSASAPAFCKAKMRLPAKLFAQLIQRPSDAAPAMYKGLKTYLVDGVSFMTPDTRQLAGKYGKGQNQRGTSHGYPTPKLLTLMQAGGGFIRRALILPRARQEFTCLSRLFKAIGSDGLLVGDSGLVSFAHMALLMGKGLQGCFRLPRWQVVFNRGKGSHRLHQRQGKQDLLVTWTASRRPTWMSNKRWAAIKDQTLTLRQISFRICRPGYRTHWAWIATTLLDPRQYPAQEVVDLYRERWQVEVNFRNLKQTLKMEMISAKTVQGVHKEVMAFILLYNLVCQVMQQASQRQGVAADRISFIDAMIWLLHSPPGTPLPPLVVNPRRTRNAPPRKLKNARHRFPQLKQPRAELSKPPCVAKI